MSVNASLIKNFSHWLHSQGLEHLSPLSGWLAEGHVRHLDREEFLLHAGDRYHCLYYIDSGLLRLFYNMPNGKERNKAFYGKPHLVGAVSAAITDRDAPFSIQALEPTCLLTLPYQPLMELTRRDGSVAQLLIKLLSEAFIRNEQREAMLLTCNADERYQWLLAHEPELLERLPQHHIASYIGVDAVSLSRLKRKRQAPAQSKTKSRNHR